MMISIMVTISFIFIDNDDDDYIKTSKSPFRAACQSVISSFTLSINPHFAPIPLE